MMQARDRRSGEPMADAQLAREVMTLVVAGHETTAGLLNWLWFLLSKRPDARAALANEFAQSPWGEAPAMDRLAEYTYTRQVIEEALRLYPPLWLMTRKAANDDLLGAFFVPAGTEIYISPYLIQRSPALWTGPDLFAPDRMSPDRAAGRPELALCPFGAGPRNCIGEHLARAEMQLHVMMVGRELTLHCDEETPQAITTGMNLLSKYDLMMRPALNLVTVR